MLSQLRLQRLLKGLKAVEVAKRAGVSPALLSRIEQGQVRPSRRVRRRLSQVLSVPERLLFSDILLPSQTTSRSVQKRIAASHRTRRKQARQTA